MIQLAGVDMGWITTEQRNEFIKYMHDKVAGMIPAGEGLGKEDLDSRVVTFLNTKFTVRPRIIMASGSDSPIAMHLQNEG